MRKTDKPNILIVDDTPENLVVLDGVLESPDYNILQARSGDEALGLMLEREFALVILDVQMPGIDGFETAELMRGSEKTKHVPIIFVTAISKENKNVFRGYESGAVDYLFKPFDSHVLKGKVKVFLELHNRKKELEAANNELSGAIRSLKDANRKILKQQKSVIEEERLKVLLQLAGTMAHELNQPLMVMTANIELMRMDKANPDALNRYLNNIEESVNRLSRTIQKIQTIRHDQTMPYAGITEIIDLDQKVTVLAVEEKDQDFRTLNSLISGQKNIELTRCTGLKDSIELIRSTPFDLVCFDIDTPDESVFEFLEYFKKEFIDIPVLILTGKVDELTALKLIQAGACDYLDKKKISSESLINRIMNTLEKVRLKKDVEKAYKRMLAISTRDDLTGLYNRNFFIECLDKEFIRAARYKTDLILCISHVDNLPSINELYGPGAGDMILTELGRILIRSIRKIDTACRYDSKEFAVMLPHTNIKNAQKMTERFRAAVSKCGFSYKGTKLNTTISTGISRYSRSEDENCLLLCKNAERALIKAREKGRNTAVIG